MYHQLAPLGDDLLLDVEPRSGRYCVLHLSRDLAAQQPLRPIGSGEAHRYAPPPVQPRELLGVRRPARLRLVLRDG